jgi:hypothetical protein
VRLVRESSQQAVVEWLAAPSEGEGHGNRRKYVDDRSGCNHALCCYRSRARFQRPHHRRRLDDRGCHLRCLVDRVLGELGWVRSFRLSASPRRRRLADVRSDSTPVEPALSPLSLRGISSGFDAGGRNGVTSQASAAAWGGCQAHETVTQPSTLSSSASASLDGWSRGIEVGSRAP